jgi:hypothetical protein
MGRTFAVGDAKEKLRTRHGALFASIKTAEYRMPLPEQPQLLDLIKARAEAVRQLTMQAIENAPLAAQEAAALFASWMDERALVRIVGTEHDRLAATLPARRLFAGGARVHIQGDTLPMPHSLSGGGIIAVTTGEQAYTVSATLYQYRRKNRDIKIIGLGFDPKNRIAEVCDTFIAVPAGAYSRGQSSQASIHAQVIAQLLDSFVLFAGRTLGYTEKRWVLGYEEIDPGRPAD